MSRRPHSSAPRSRETGRRRHREPDPPRSSSGNRAQQLRPPFSTGPPSPPGTCEQRKRNSSSAPGARPAGGGACPLRGAWGLSTPGRAGACPLRDARGQLGSITPRPGAHSHHPPGLCRGHPHPSDEKTKLWGPWGPPQITLVVQGCPTQGATDKAHGREESAPRPAPQRVARRDRRRQVHTHAHGGATHTSQKAQPPGLRQRRSG